MSTPAAPESRALELFQTVMSVGIDGQGPLKSSRDLGEEYLSDPRYESHEHRIDALVKWETTKNFTTGFATGLGGIATLPVAVPARDRQRVGHSGPHGCRNRTRPWL